MEQSHHFQNLPYRLYNLISSKNAGFHKNTMVIWNVWNENLYISEDIKTARIQVPSPVNTTDGRNYLRIIFLKNIDFSVKTICKDKYLQKCLHKDASEEDIFTASFWKFFLKKFKHFRKESSKWRFKESLLWLWNKSLIEFEKTSLKTSPILKV